MRRSIVMWGMIFGSIALCTTSARAQPSPDRLTYEEWQEVYRNEFRSAFKPWSHEEPLDVRARRAARWWAEEGYYGPEWHGALYYAFVTLGDGWYYGDYQARWLAECLANGDIVIPFLSGIRFDGYRGVRIGDGEPRPLEFVVFHVGTPPEAVEGVIRSTFPQRYLLTPEEIEDVIRTYRGLVGLPLN